MNGPKSAHTWNVSEGLSNSIVFVVDDARSLPHDPSSIPHFSFARAESFALTDLLDVGPGVELAQQTDGLFGLFKGFNFVFDDERDLGDLFHLNNYRGIR